MQSIRLVLSLVILFSFLITTGCTNLQTPTAQTTTFQPLSPKQRQLALTRLTAWHIDGAFSIREPNKTTLANYQWQQKGTRYQIRIYSALDLYGIRILGEPGFVALWRSDKRVTANSPEQLLQNQLGWQLPVSNLYYWLRGIAAPGLYQARFDRFGHLRQLQQQDWQISYTQYGTFGQYDLPQLLELRYKNIAVRLVIKRWYPE